MPQNLANSLWAYAVLKIPLFAELFEQYEAQIIKSEKEFDLKAYRLLYVAYQYYEKPLPFSIDHKAFRDQKGIMTTAKNYVFELLSKEGGDINMEYFYYVDCMASTVDGYQAPTNTLIYVDSPYTLCTDGTLCLADQLSDTIAKKHGYTVMRIKLPEIDMTQRMQEVIQLSYPDIQAVMKHVKGCDGQEGGNVHRKNSRIDRCIA